MNRPPVAVQVRRMTPSDLDHVIEIEHSLAAAPHWPRSAYLTALDPQVSPPRIALVAVEPGSDAGALSDGPSSLGWGAVAGFAVASLLPPHAELETIAVSAQLQRRGLARRLFASLVAEFRAAGIMEVILEVRASNDPARGFYRRLGFVETGSRPLYYIDPVEDAVLMRLPL